MAPDKFWLSRVKHVLAVAAVVALTLTLATPALAAGGDAPLNMNTASASFVSGATAVAGAVFTDSDPAGSTSQYRGTVNWGDGSVTPGFFSSTCGAFAFGSAHTYASLGTYSVHIGIRDVGGASTGANVRLSPRPTWIAAGNLVSSRFGHTATALNNGTVLLAGGSNPSFTTSSSEVFNPACGRWTSSGNLAGPRNNHTAALLQNGRVLVVGGDAGPPGLPCCQPALATAELYNPATGTWSGTGALQVAREFDTLTLLPSGKVLIAGGGAQLGSPTDDYTKAELYDPSTGVWSLTGNISRDRRNPTATLLPSGKVLLAGGESNQACQCPAPVLASAELYDPSTGVWTATGSMFTAREVFTATLLPNGKVLVAGGQTDSTSGLAGATAAAELYDPSTGTWMQTGSMTTPRVVHTATLLGGKVLVAGGLDAARNQLASAEIYDPATGVWTATGSMNGTRAFHTATLFGGGVLVAGGPSGPQGTAELYLM